MKNKVLILLTFLSFVFSQGKAQTTLPAVDFSVTTQDANCTADASIKVTLSPTTNYDDWDLVYEKFDTNGNSVGLASAEFTNTGEYSLTGLSEDGYSYKFKLRHKLSNTFSTKEIEGIKVSSSYTPPTFRVVSKEAPSSYCARNDGKFRIQVGQEGIGPFILRLEEKDTSGNYVKIKDSELLQKGEYYWFKGAEGTDPYDLTSGNKRIVILDTKSETQEINFCKGLGEIVEVPEPSGNPLVVTYIRFTPSKTIPYHKDKEVFPCGQYRTIVNARIPSRESLKNSLVLEENAYMEVMRKGETTTTKYNLNYSGSTSYPTLYPEVVVSPGDKIRVVMKAECDEDSVDSGFQEVPELADGIWSGSSNDLESNDPSCGAVGQGIKIYNYAHRYFDPIKGNDGNRIIIENPYFYATAYNHAEDPNIRTFDPPTYTGDKNNKVTISWQDPVSGTYSKVYERYDILRDRSATPFINLPKTGVYSITVEDKCGRKETFTRNIASKDRNFKFQGSYGILPNTSSFRIDHPEFQPATVTVEKIDDSGNIINGTDVVTIPKGQQELLINSTTTNVPGFNPFYSLAGTYTITYPLTYQFHREKLNGVETTLGVGDLPEGRYKISAESCGGALVPKTLLISDNIVQPYDTYQRPMKYEPEIDVILNCSRSNQIKYRFNNRRSIYRLYVKLQKKNESGVFEDFATTPSSYYISSNKEMIFSELPTGTYRFRYYDHRFNSARGFSATLDRAIGILDPNDKFEYFSNEITLREPIRPEWQSKTEENFVCTNGNTGFIVIEEYKGGDVSYPLTFRLYRKSDDQLEAEYTYNSASDYTDPNVPVGGHIFKNIPVGTYKAVIESQPCYPLNTIPDIRLEKNVRVRVYKGTNNCPGEESRVAVSLSPYLYNIEWFEKNTNKKVGDGRSVTISPTVTTDYEIRYQPKSIISGGCGTNGEQVHTFTYDVITDSTAPSITNCPSDILKVAGIGTCTAVVTWTEPTITDNCGYTVTSTHSSGDSFPLGTTLVTYVAKDKSGNTATCTFEVTVSNNQELELSVNSRMESGAGQNRSGSEVSLGEELWYKVSYRNSKSESIYSSTLTITIPDNVIFDDSLSGVDFSDSIYTTSTGVVIEPTYSYDVSSRELKVVLPSELTATSSPERSFKIPFKLSDEIQDFKEACSNYIEFVTEVAYEGGNRNCLKSLSTSTRSYITVDTDTSRLELFCGSPVGFTAGSGYSSYQWYKNGSLVTTNQTYTATTAGTYRVVKKSVCGGKTLTSEEVITLEDAQGVTTHPLLGDADSQGKCDVNGTIVAHYFLCEGQSSRKIRTGYVNTTDIVWQKMKSTCHEPRANCPDLAGSDCWEEIGKDVSSLDLGEDGSYRILVKQGTCDKVYYFNIYKNGISGVVTKLDKSDYNSGNIRVVMNSTGLTYTYVLKDASGTNTIQGPVTKTDKDHTFDNLDKGTYQLEVSSNIGCTFTQEVEIIENTTLTFIANQGDWTGCNQLEFIFEAQGGKAPYHFAIWSIDDKPLYSDYNQIPSSAFLDSASSFPYVSDKFRVLRSGKYVFVLKDSQGVGIEAYKTSNPVQVILNTDYDFTLTPIDISCSKNPKTGSVSAQFVNTGITAGNRNTTFTLYKEGVPTPIGDNRTGNFSALEAGDYRMVLHVQIGTEDCYFEKLFSIADAEPLRAFAGVIEDKSCDTNSPQRYKVRISNPSGGTAPYQYSFTGTADADFGTSNEGYVSGSQSVYMKDAKGCIETFTVTVQRPNIPTVTPTVTYECDGRGMIHIETNPTASVYSYTYWLDGQEKSLNASGMIVGVSTGTHLLEVRYKDPSFTGDRNVLYREDFGVGQATALRTVSIATTLCFESQDANIAEGCAGDSNEVIDNHQYSISERIVHLESGWTQPPTQSGTGRYLTARTSNNTALYRTNLKDVTAGEPLYVSLKAMGVKSNNAKIAVRLRGETKNSSPLTNTWERLEFRFNNPQANSVFEIRLITEGKEQVVSLDDIEVYQMTKLCKAYGVTKSVEVESDREFNATLLSVSNPKCHDSNDWQARVSVSGLNPTEGYQYAIDTGSNTLSWSAVQTQPEVTISDATISSTSFMLRFRKSTQSSCLVELPINLTRPSSMSVTVEMLEPIRCQAGAVAKVRLNVTGGTQPYAEYRVVGSGWGTSSEIGGLTSGSHVFEVKDANGCIASVTYEVADSKPIEFNTFIDCTSSEPKAVVTVDITNGNGNYRYKIFSGHTATKTAEQYSGLSPLTGTVINEELAPGKYTIVIQDGLGCAKKEEITIAEPLRLRTHLKTDIGNCKNEITIHVLGGVISTTTSKLSWSHTLTGTQSTSDIVQVGVRTYTLSVPQDGKTYYFHYTDDAGCRPVNVPNKVQVLDMPRITILSTTSATCTESSDGSFEYQITGGSPAYELSIYKDDGNGQISGGLISNEARQLAGGNYVVRVTDSNTCESDLVPFKIGKPDKLDYTLAKTDLQCSGNTTTLGTIDVNVLSGGNGLTNTITLYNEYGGQVSQRTSVPHGTSVHFTDIDFGKYVVEISDANGCTTQTETSISTPANVLITTSTRAGCDKGEMKVVATNTGSGSGVREYYFSVYPPQAPFDSTNPTANGWYRGVGTTGNEYTFTELTPGVRYYFVVHDRNGCEYVQEATVDVKASSTLKAHIVAKDVTCKGSNDGRLEIKITNSTLSTTTTAIKYEVRNQRDHTVVSGKGGTQSRGAGAETAITIDGLEPGNYYVVFTEMKGATEGCKLGTKGYVIEEVSEALSEPQVKLTKATCQSRSGRISVTVQGGRAPYQYAYVEVASATAPVSTPSSGDWKNNSTERVNAGYYYVFVKDAVGCVKHTAMVIEVEKIPTPSIASVHPINVCGAEGYKGLEISMNALGTLPLQVRINGNLVDESFVTIDQARTKVTIRNLSSGKNQTLRIVDKYGCSVNTTFNMPNNVYFNAEVTQLLSCNTSAEITIDNINGGVSPYEYSIEYRTFDSDVVSTTASSTLSNTNIYTEVRSRTAVTGNRTTWTGASLAGYYLITVYDQNCSVSKEVRVEEKLYPEARITNVSDERCDSTGGAGSGSITLRVKDNGTGAFQFTISDIDGLTPAEEALVSKPILSGYGVTFTGLKGTPSGVLYTISITSQNGCEQALQQIVYSPRPIEIDPTAITLTQYACAPGSNRSREAEVRIDKAKISGGSGNYTRFVFERGGVPLQDGSRVVFKETDKVGGSYVVYVYDDKGCVGTSTAQVIRPFVGLKTLSLTKSRAIDCTQGETIKAVVTLDPVTATTPNLRYELTDLATNTMIGTPHTGTDLSYTFDNGGAGYPVGNYKIVVTNEDTGCQISSVYDILEPNTFELSVLDPKHNVCKGASNGEITLSFRDLYLLDGDQAHNGFEYTITDVSDPTHTYTGNVLGATTRVSGLKAGRYEAVAKSKNPLSCETPKVYFTIREPNSQAELKEMLMVYPPACSNDKGEIRIRIEGGTPPYTAKLYKDGGLIKTAPDIYGYYTFTGLSGGVNPMDTADYTVEFTDSQNCVVTQSTTVITLERPEPITATATSTNVSCVGVEDGVVEIVTATGGSGVATYFYSLENVATGEKTYPEKGKNRFDKLPIGEYRIIVIDDWGCDGTTNSVKIEAPDPILISISSTTEMICYGENNGEISLSVTGGTGNYTVKLTDARTNIEKETKVATVSQTITFSGLSPDTFYIIDATDDSSCNSSNPYSFSIPQSPNLSAVVMQIHDCVSNTYESELEVAFDTTPTDFSLISYALNSTDPSHGQSFDYTVGSRAYIRNFDSSQPNQYLTIFVKSGVTGTTYCDSGQLSFTVEEVRQLDIKSLDSTTKVNTVSVEAQYGKPPYTFYFNGVDAGTGVKKDYLVRRSDEGYVNAQGQQIKRIKVRVEDTAGGGCYQERTVEVVFYDIMIPDYFTPDNDGNNDKWFVHNTISYPLMLVRIYDRYGRELALLKQGEKWDGKYRGKELPAGDYWYLIELNDPSDDRTFTGGFTLYR